MTALVTCAEQLASLTTALAAATPAQIAALGSAMGLHPGVVAPVIVADGTPIPPFTALTFASLVVTNPGKVAISASGGLRQGAANTPGDSYIVATLVERVRGGVTTRIAGTSDTVHTGNNETVMVAPNAVCNNTTVQAGDVINAYVIFFGTPGSDPTPWQFQGAIGEELGIFMHYIR